MPVRRTPAEPAGPKPRIAVFAGPTATILNSLPLVTGHKAAEKYGLEFLPAQGLGYGDVRPTLRELAGEGASLMIAHASGYNTAAPEIAAETNVPVAIVDRPDALKPGLIADYTLSGHEGAYLAGRLAAKTTTSRTPKGMAAMTICSVCPLVRRQLVPIAATGCSPRPTSSGAASIQRTARMTPGTISSRNPAMMPSAASSVWPR